LKLDLFALSLALKPKTPPNFGTSY